MSIASFSPLPTLPLEVINVVIGFLDQETLRAARLIDRRCSRVATELLFDHITMTPTYSGFARWQSLMEKSDLSRWIARCVLNTSPVPDYMPWKVYGDEDADVHQCAKEWRPLRYFRSLTLSADEQARLQYENVTSRYADFLNAFESIVLMPLLNDVTVHFEPFFPTGRRDWHHCPSEPIWYRALLLKRLITKLSDRLDAKGQTSVVRTLCLQNLHEIKSKDTEFYPMLDKVLRNIDSFKVLVTQDFIDSATYRSYYPTRRTRSFQSFKRHWLKPMSRRLTSLDLAFQEPWGSFTSIIKPDELFFPKLKHLRLERFAPSTDASTQWIFNQSTIESLVLHDCQIVSCYVMSEQEAVRRGFDTEKGSDFAFAGEPGGVYHFYQYDATWSEHFDLIGKNLEKLISFSVDGSDYTADSYRQKYHIYQPQSPSIVMANSRYTSFSTESTHDSGPWQGPDENGELEGLLGGIFPPSGDMLADENYETDMAGLQRLMKKIESRKVRPFEV